MKNHGYTLVELVIVVGLLVVIALIVSPFILGMIEDSKKQSFKKKMEEFSDVISKDAMNRDWQPSDYYQLEQGTVTYYHDQEKDSWKVEGYDNNLSGEVHLEEGDFLYHLYSEEYCGIQKKDQVTILTYKNYSKEDCFKQTIKN